METDAAGKVEESKEGEYDEGELEQTDARPSRSDRREKRSLQQH